MDSEENQEENSSNENDKSTLVSPRSGRPIKKQKGAPGPQSAITLPPSPPTFVTMGQLAEAANAFYNMSLAHEITVDSDFKIEKYEPPEESLENCIKKTMHRAFWDLLRSSLEGDPPDYEPTLRLLAEVKQSLNGLVLPHQKTLQKLIDDSLDLDVVRAELQETGSLSLDAYAERVISLMKQFCAPVRDKEVEELRHISDPVDAFQHAFTLLEKMHMDLANFTIAQMRPYIRQQAVAYERNKFATFLETQQAIGIDGLARTRQWIQEAYRQLTSTEQSALSDSHPEPTSRVPLSSDSAVSSLDVSASSAQTKGTTEPKPANASGVSIAPTPNNILRESYLALLTWPATKDWPETMIMDQQRLTDLGKQLAHIVTLSSLVLVVCNYVIANIHQIFPGSSGLCTDNTNTATMMLELKQSVCRTALNAINNIPPEKSPDPELDAADQIVLTVEHWYNRVMNQHAARAQEASAVADCASVGPAPHVFPKTVSVALQTQIHEVFQATHPVYTLMHKRAMDFLRCALSSHPPEPLPLPAGFGVLLDVTGESFSSPHLPGAGASPAGPSLMATGGHNRPVRPPRFSDDDALFATPPQQQQPSLSGPNSLSLSNVASRLLSLLAHNRHVFGPRYAEIIQALLVHASTPTQANDTTERDTTFEINP